MKVLYYSLVDWKWIKQRPQFICIHLLKKGLDVDFAYPSVIAKALFARNYFVKNDGFPHLCKIKIRQLPKENALPFIKHINEKYRFKQLERLFSREKYQIVIITHPNLFSDAVMSSACKIVFEMMDDYSSFGNIDNIAKYLKKEEELCNISKAIIVSSLSLKKLLISRYPDNKKKIFIVNNAYDAESFLTVGDESGVINYECPNKGKRLVYIGTISNWLDHKSLVAYAKQHPEDTIQLVGPIENLDTTAETSMRDQNNIEIIGPVEHKIVKSYIIGGDVMLIPFVVNKLIEYVDPIKVYEYIYFRKPIVCSYWEEMDRFCSFVEFYNPNKDKSLQNAIGRAIVKKIEPDKQRNFIENNTWSTRAEVYANILEQIMI